MITENLQRLLNECIMLEDGNYLGGKFSVNLKDCQNELDEIKQNSHKHSVMQGVPIDQVRKLLEEQRRLTASSLEYSSAIYIYPQDFDKMFDWMMRTPIVSTGTPTVGREREETQE